MKILQPRFLFFFCWMLIVPAAIAYFGNFDRKLDAYFFLRAFAIAFCITVVYYLLLKKAGKV